MFQRQVAVHIPVKDAHGQGEEHREDDIEAGHVRVAVQILPGELSEDVENENRRPKEEVLL